MRLIPLGSIIIYSFCLFSCGPGKELVSAQAKTDSLNKVVTHLNSQLDQLTTQSNQQSATLAANKILISQLKQQNLESTQEASECKEIKEAEEKKMAEIHQALAEE